MPPNPAPSLSPDRPLEALWQARAIFWVVAGGEALAAVLALAPGIATDRWVYFGLASLWVLWMTLLTLATLYVARERLNRLAPPRVGAIALLIGLVYCGLITGGAAWFFGSALSSAGMDWWDLGMKTTGITLAVGLLGLAAFDNYWLGRLNALRAKQSELEALQARIRPHFLFNTLNTATALVHARPAEAERLLLDLADLFRAALAGPRDIPLADELALARRYLEIESLRFGPRLELTWNLPASLPDTVVPALSIQPLVENAIRHGVEPSANGARVEVAVEVDGDAVQIVVSNDLPPRGATPASGHHVGLASARGRIEALSQGRGTLHTETRDGRFFATVRMPLA